MAKATKKAAIRSDQAADRNRSLAKVARQYAGKSTLHFDKLLYEADLTNHRTKAKMRRDPVIALGMWTIKAPIASSDFTIKCADPTVRAFVARCIRPLWERLLKSSLLSLDFGWQCHELIFAVEDIRLKVEDYSSKDPDTVASEVDLPSMVVLKQIKDLNPISLRPVYDEQADVFVGVEQTGVEAPSPVLIPVDKLLVITNDMEWGDVRGRSLLDNAYRPWYFGYMVEQLWARYMESRAVPPVIGTGPIGSRVNAETGETYHIEDVMLAILNNLQGGSAAYLPHEADATTRKNSWGIEPLAFPQSADQFDAYMAKIDALKLRGLLVPEKAVIQGSKVGTMSETQQFTDTFMIGLDRIIRALQSAFNEQLIPKIVALNFADAPTCELVISELTSQRRTALKDFAGMLATASATNRHGIRYKYPDLIDLERLSEQFGIPIRDPDSILTPSEDPNDDGSDPGSPPDKGRKTGDKQP